MRLFRSPLNWLRRLKRAGLDFQASRSLSRISRSLATSGGPNTVASEAAFDALQKEYNGVPEYGYDDYSIWFRATGRANSLLGLLPDQSTGRRVLEVGCGDAVTSYLLAAYGHQVSCADLADWRDSRCRHLPFFAGPLELGMPVTDGTYDLVFSYNTFEHLADPAVCLQELIRVCKPGGLIYLSFDPLYGSPWGLHAYRSLRMPYPQFLFSEPFLMNKLREIGIRDLGENRTELQPMNRWTVGRFDALWNDSGCRIRSLNYNVNEQHLGLVERFPEAFYGRGLTVRDLVTSGVHVLLQRGRGD